MSQRYKFYTCDVFTRQRFSGNQLAVLPDARGLSATTMQAIAREFNFSATTFVLPPENPQHTARVRIFTPGYEMPFAGHPTVGTAFVLATVGAVPRQVNDIVLEEGVGPVPVTIERRGDAVDRCTFTTARLPEEGPPGPPPTQLARMLQIDAHDVLDAAECWSCGVPFLVVPLANAEVLARCTLELAAWRSALGGYATQNVYPVARLSEETWKVRMFAPTAGIGEDPATGSAAAAFAGWLQRRSKASQFTLLQGEFVGRPSEIALMLTRSDAALSQVRVGGASVMVSEGTLEA